MYIGVLIMVRATYMNKFIHINMIYMHLVNIFFKSTICKCEPESSLNSLSNKLLRAPLLPSCTVQEAWDEKGSGRGGGRGGGGGGGRQAARGRAKHHLR